MKYYVCSNRLNVHENGFLEIKVMDDKSIPASDALISVSRISYTGIYNESAEGLVLADFYTDNSGIIQLELPVLNELVGSSQFYSAKISKEGYYDVYIFYIQTYPDITSSYDVYLTPITRGVEKFMFLFQPKVRRIHEH
jgi:hypothetical protein